MNIHKVTIEGFGPFKERQVVDFDAFADDGIFVITGRTGAGKSSVLDAVTFALFGRVPRYGNKMDEEIRSKYLVDSPDPTRVEVEFSEGDKRYRVWRTATYTKPGNKTPTQSTAEVSDITDGTEQVIAARKMSDVGAAIDAIVQLNADQFTQVILLAQGEFQRFLVADSKERRQLLRKLFDTGRFLDYAVDLDARAAALKERLDHTREYLSAATKTLAAQADVELPAGIAGADADTILAWVEPLAAAKAEELATASAAADTATDHVKTALAVLTAARETAKAQQRRDEAIEQQRRLAEEVAGVAADRDRLDAARRAALVEPSLKDEREARARVAGAEAMHDTARAAFGAFGPAQSAEVAELERISEDLTGEAARLRADEQREQGLAALAAKVAQTQRGLDDATGRLTACEAKVAALTTEAPDFAAEIAAQEGIAATLSEAEQARAGVGVRLAAARKVESLTADLTRAETDHVAARKRADETQRDHTALIERRLAEQAGTLAETLRDGEPCRVCGSTDHPAPAEIASDRVTEDDLAAAEAAEEIADKAAVAAAELVATLKGRRGDEIATMGEGDITSITAAATQAAAAVESATAAAAKVKELHRSQEQHHRDVREAKEAVSQAAIAVTAAEGEAKAAQTAHQQDTAAVEAARGDFSSVTARLSNVLAERDAAKQLIAATTALAAARETLESAAGKAAAALSEHSFADPRELEAALLPQPEQQRLDERINDHVSETKKVAAILAEPELADLPDEPIDVATPEAAHRAAGGEHERALSRLGSARTIATVVSGIVDDIRTQLVEASAVHQEQEVVRELADVVNGRGSNTKRMALETYALAADLEEIVAHANVLLGRMTADRYELVHTDERARHGAASGLGIAVVDAYNGESRPPESLSGGEKFQASLALALGLAEVVTSRNGGVRLDTLFIDEGFGHLDEESLAEVLDTMDLLREGGRTVGLISHVDQVKERIRNHLQVEAGPEGWSTIRAE